jgi:hypothetical protein
MDLYTTSFTFPRPSPRSIRNSSSPLPPNLPLPGSGILSNIALPNVTSATTTPKKPSSSVPFTTTALVEKDWDGVQKMCLAITTREGCLVTVSKEQLGMDLGGSPSIPMGHGEKDAPIPDSTLWNFHLSGGYQSVMAARGAILRETPQDNRTVIKVARTDILESPLATISPLKPDVRRYLDEIAADSHAHVAVLNMDVPGSSGLAGTVLATADGQGGFADSATEGQEGTHSAVQDAPTGSGSSSANGTTGDAVTNISPTKPREETQNGQSSSALDSSQPTTSKTAPVTYRLETERMCELVLTGTVESVEIAKVRLLVMLDELVNPEST